MFTFSLHLIQNKRSCVVSCLESKELVMSWLLWHQVVKFLQHDIPLVEEAEVRFPRQYSTIFRLIGKEAYYKV